MSVCSARSPQKYSKAAMEADDGSDRFCPKSKHYKYSRAPQMSVSDLQASKTLKLAENYYMFVCFCSKSLKQRLDVYLSLSLFKHTPKIRKSILMSCCFSLASKMAAWYSISACFCSNSKNTGRCLPVAVPRTSKAIKYHTSHRMSACFCSNYFQHWLNILFTLSSVGYLPNRSWLMRYLSVSALSLQDCTARMDV
jgi:hypothetical protein